MKMVCKEDVVLWLEKLEWSERINFMYGCVCSENRFVGNCIEEIGHVL